MVFVCAPLLQLLSDTDLLSSSQSPEAVASLVHAAVADLKKADWRARAANKRAAKKQRQQQRRRQQQQHPSSTSSIHPTDHHCDGIEYPALELALATHLPHHTTAVVVGVYAGLAGQLPPQHRLLRLLFLIPLPPNGLLSRWWQ